MLYLILVRVYDRIFSFILCTLGKQHNSILIADSIWKVYSAEGQKLRIFAREKLTLMYDAGTDLSRVSKPGKSCFTPKVDHTGPELGETFKKKKVLRITALHYIFPFRQPSFSPTQCRWEFSPRKTKILTHWALNQAATHKFMLTLSILQGHFWPPS